MNNADSSSELDEGGSYWLTMMTECLENPATKLPPSKKLLILGDNEAEKTNLISKLQGWTQDNGRKGNGLEYRYFNVRDEYCENQTRLGIWILDEDPCFQPLLGYALDGESLADTTVMLAASMTKPWDIFRTIHTWIGILKNHIENLDVSPSFLEERKQKVLDRYREYLEPGLSIYGSLMGESQRELAVNLGVELIIVITRTEYMKELQSDFGYENEHFDFIQFALREFCLSHGAALFYVSMKEDKNCDLLLKYILHKIYAFPFRIPAILLERDSVFVPSGWDTENKIRFLSETLSTIPLSTPYEEVVFQPGRLLEDKRTAPEIVAEGDQEFLLAMEYALSKQAQSDSIPEGAKEAASMTAAVVQRNVARRVARTQVARAPQKKPETNLGTGEGDTVLHTFFKSLLNRRTSAPVDRPVGLSGNRTYIPKGTTDTHNCNEHNRTRDRNLSESTSGVSVSSKRLEMGEASKFSSGEDAVFKEEAEPVQCSGNSKMKNTMHLSLDQDKGIQQLPEYFMSHSGGGVCAPDCCMKNGSSLSCDEEDEDLEPQLDRVRSSFNPPLKTLLEKNDGQCCEPELTNGFTQQSSRNRENSNSISGIPESLETSGMDMPSELNHVISSMPCNQDSFSKNSVVKT